MCMIGPSGAGKSTIFKLLSMMSKRDQGDICLDGVPFETYFSDYRRAQGLEIGIVFQEDVLWQDQSLDENLLIVARFRGINEGVVKSRMD